MGIDERQPVEHVLFDDPAERHHHSELGPHLGRVLGPAAHRQAQLEGGRLDRARPGGLLAAPTLVGPAHHHGDVMAGGDDGPEATTAGSGVPRKAMRRA